MIKKTEDLFDLNKGREKRDAGIALVSINNKEFIAEMRKFANDLAKHTGQVHVDDVREYAIAKGIRPNHSNAWGAVFRGSEFTQSGEYRASRLISNHGHRSPVWILAGSA
jgi:hypothetical protein